MSFLAIAAAALALASPSKPNIVLVTIDPLRADHVGRYGAPPGSTPALDALASEGLRFENAISPVPLTRPAHTSLLTGLYPPEHGIRDNLPAKLRQHRTDHIVSVALDGAVTLLFGDHDLVHLFAGADTDNTGFDRPSAD